MFSDENNEKINPSNIKLIYDTPCALPSYYYVDMWSAMMSVAVHAFFVSTLALQSIAITT